MKGSREWDHAYKKQGRLWGGAPLVPDLQENARVLELGCGNGKMSAALAEKAYELIALDFSLHACRLAKKKVAGFENANVLVADAGALPLAMHSVDTVIANHVLGHGLHDTRAAIVREVVRVLAPGGHFIFCDFSTEDFRAGTGSEVERNTYRRGNDIITHYFTQEEAETLSDRLQVLDLQAHRRTLRIRRRDYLRSEIVITFVKN